MFHEEIGKMAAPALTRIDPAATAEFFAENGYFILPDALTPAEIEELRADTTYVCRNAPGTTRDAGEYSVAETDAEVLERYLCIHFPHKLSDTMYRYLAHPAIVDVLTAVIGPNVKCMQSMLFIKAAGKPGQAWHQDEIYIPTRDRSLAGAWIAMDDATIENGCLWVIPGSHKRGVIYPQALHNDERFDCADQSYGFPYTDDDAIPVEVRAGAIVFFNGYLLHRSLPNYAKTGYRRVLVNHYMSAESLLPWHNPRGNERMATADTRDIVMVAGEDPYAYKGVEQLSVAHVRPSGKGGCGDPRQNLSEEDRAKIDALPYDNDDED
jgi:phytanoyl-CoA hydroxylase